METVLFAVGTLTPLLLVLVVVHELGHFATARAFGVKVLEFGVGFPPRAFGFYTGRTPVMLHPQTQFVGLEGPQDLRPGQRVKVGSLEDQEVGLVAFEQTNALTARLSGEYDGVWPAHIEAERDHLRDIRGIVDDQHLHRGFPPTT